MTAYHLAESALREAIAAVRKSDPDLAGRLSDARATLYRTHEALRSCFTESGAYCMQGETAVEEASRLHARIRAINSTVAEGCPLTKDQLAESARA